jgi:hypothetical protein
MSEQNIIIKNELLDFYNEKQLIIKIQKLLDDFESVRITTKYIVSSYSNIALENLEYRLNNNPYNSRYIINKYNEKDTKYTKFYCFTIIPGIDNSNGVKCEIELRLLYK